jgi:hypothetical protein
MARTRSNSETAAKNANLSSGWPASPISCNCAS